MKMILHASRIIIFSFTIYLNAPFKNAEFPPTKKFA